MSAKIDERFVPLKQGAAFVYRTLSGVANIFRYRNDTLNQIYIMGNQALPLVLIAVSCVSMVLALEWGKKLEPFGAKLMLGRLVGITVIRNLGPTIAGLMLAGRTGAKLVSEIGNMVLSEQIDALRAFGTDPIKRLIVPRVYASMIVMIPVTAIADFIGIVAGWFSCVTWLGVDSQFFWLSMKSGVVMKDLIIGLAKPPFYGLIIGLIGSYYGYNISGGAVGMGRAATRTVMLASVGVLIMDFILTRIILSIY